MTDEFSKIQVEYYINDSKCTKEEYDRYCAFQHTAYGSVTSRTGMKDGAFFVSVIDYNLIQIDQPKAAISQEVGDD